MSYQKEYPQLYAAWEIAASMSYPPSPIAPQKPKKPIKPQPPRKYEDFFERLFGLGIFSVLFLIDLLFCFLDSVLSFVLLIPLGIGLIYSLYASCSSLVKTKNFKDKLEAYEKTLEEYDKSLIEYEKKCKQYEEEKIKYQKDFEDYEKLISEDSVKYKLQQRQLFLNKTKSKERHAYFFDLDGSEKHPKVGEGEFFFRNYIDSAKIKKKIPSEFDFYFNTSVEVYSDSLDSKVNYFYPDILVLTPRGLLIDVEIDEPYTYDTKKPIHCIHSLNNHDDSRNSYFTQNNCSVIRFTERQVVRYPEICLRIILSFDDYASMPKNLVLPPDFIEKSWYEKDALKMAAENYRDSYLEDNMKDYIIEDLPVYQLKWKEKERRKFSADEIAAVKEAVVVDSDYGYTVQFTMVSGGLTFIPLATTSSLKEGDIVDMNKAILITLCKPGEDDIIRVHM